LQFDRLSDIRGDLDADLANTQACGLDSLIQHFIYLVLDPGSPEKIKLDELQAEIESLEAELQSPEQDDTPEVSLPGDTTAGEQASIPSQSRLDKLYEERHEILSGVYANCLEAVLPICNDPTVYKHLKN